LFLHIQATFDETVGACPLLNLRITVRRFGFSLRF
jgi:hypothetical protein